MEILLASLPGCDKPARREAGLAPPSTPGPDSQAQVQAYGALGQACEGENLALLGHPFDVDGFVPDIVPHLLHDGIRNCASACGYLATASRFAFRRLCRVPNPNQGSLDQLHFLVHAAPWPPAR